jgi:hypothetical protein
MRQSAPGDTAVTKLNRYISSNIERCLQTEKTAVALLCCRIAKEHRMNIGQ